MHAAERRHFQAKCIFYACPLFGGIRMWAYLQVVCLCEGLSTVDVPSGGRLGLGQKEYSTALAILDVTQASVDDSLAAEVDEWPHKHRVCCGLELI